ncbi:MAG: lipid A biosynthesis lauroyl acyltransferase [Alphaproteobacteria bacterium]
MLRLKILAGRLAAAVVAGAVMAVFLAARIVPTRWMSAFGGRVAWTVGRHLRATRIARENLAAAFPEKPTAERERILRAAWDNLGRTAAEYPHIGRIWDYDPEHPEASRRIEVVGAEYFLQLRDDGRPGIIFAAHLANWELLAVAGARHGLDLAVLYREPNNPFVARLIRRIRGRHMGRLIPTDLRGGLALMGVLRQGGHVGMLVDQHFSRGVPGTFLGRPVRTAPAVAKFARAFDCPVHGARAVRLPGGRFRIELTPPLELPPRDPDTHADEAQVMAAVNVVVERWVRERPEDWLWMHRRWRPEPVPPPAPMAGGVDKGRYGN